VSLYDSSCKTPRIAIFIREIYVFKCGLPASPTSVVFIRTKPDDEDHNEDDHALAHCPSPHFPASSPLTRAIP
jgi:hypothetical protein